MREPDLIGFLLTAKVGPAEPRPRQKAI